MPRKYKYKADCSFLYIEHVHNAGVNQENYLREAEQILEQVLNILSAHLYWIYLKHVSIINFREKEYLWVRTKIFSLSSEDILWLIRFQSLFKF